MLLLPQYLTNFRAYWQLRRSCDC